MSFLTNIRNTWIEAYFELAGWLKIRRAVKKARGLADWELHKLRHDWVYRVYTVINPTEYDKGDSAEVLKIKATDRAMKIGAFIDSLGIAGRVGVSMEKVGESDSYLLVYYPLFKEVTLWRLIWVPTFFIVLVWAACVYGPGLYQNFFN